MALPDGVVVSHCGTAARAAEVMVALYGGVWNSGDTKKSLEALALRKKAEKEMENGNFSEAELLLSQVVHRILFFAFFGNENVDNIVVKCKMSLLKILI